MPDKAVQTEALPKPRAIRGPRYYTIYRGPTNLLGVHHGEWAAVERLLPGGKLCGSGCGLEGFNTLSAAAALWESKHTDQPEYHEHEFLLVGQ